MESATPRTVGFRNAREGHVKQNHYGRLGAVLSADLINLPEMSAASVQSLLEEHEIRRPAVVDADVDGFRDWRDQLARVFGSTDAAEQCSAVNDLLVAATIRPWVTTHDGLQPHLHFVPDSADVISRVKAVTAGGLAFVLCWEGEHGSGAVCVPSAPAPMWTRPGTGDGGTARHAAGTPKR